MDIISSLLDFDLSSYLLGASSIGAGLYARNRLFRFKKVKTGETKVDEIQGMLAKYEPEYVKYAELYSSLEELYTVAQAKYDLEFPQDGNGKVKFFEGAYGKNTSTWSQYAQSLDGRVTSTKNHLATLLTLINTLKNSPLEKLDLFALKGNLELAVSDLRSTTYNLENQLKNAPSMIDNHKAYLKSLINQRESLLNRMAKARTAAEEIQSKYDPLYWNSLPASLARAEKAYENMDAVQSITLEEYHVPSKVKTSMETMETMLRRLEKNIYRLSNFGETAHKKTVKLRREMNNEWNYMLRRIRLNAVPEEYQKRHSKALLSLVEAETREYAGGNPEKDFEETVKPFQGLIYALKNRIAE